MKNLAFNVYCDALDEREVKHVKTIGHMLLLCPWASRLRTMIERCEVKLPLSNQTQNSPMMRVQMSFHNGLNLFLAPGFALSQKMQHFVAQPAELPLGTAGLHGSWQFIGL